MLQCPLVLEKSPASQAPGDEWIGRRVHLIGIGGCGMSGAAAMLLARGAVVSGSDQKPFDGSGDLVAAGAVIHTGHDACFLPQRIDLVVISAAIPESNAELAAARRRGIRVIRYAQLLGEIMDTRRGLAVAGTHGKSTTTAMLAHIFRTAGFDPSFVVGARSEQLGGNSAAGAGEHFIVEACEYARSFLEFRPQAAAILNIEAEHLDCYKNLAEIQAAFAEFAAQVRPGGLVLTLSQDRAVAEAARLKGVLHQTFGVDGPADWSAANLRAHQGCHSFEVLFEGRRAFGRQAFKTRLAGQYNVGNALAAIAMAAHEGVPAEAMRRGVESFTGVDRRMSRRAEVRGVTILDDYAHHPTEIRVTLSAIRDRYQPKRVWVIFQPHQASRLRHLMQDFAGSFASADVVVLADVYSVRDSELDRREIRSSELASLIHDRGGDARYWGNVAELTRHVEENVTAGDLVVTMGAGDVWKIADDLAQRFRRAS